MLCCWQYLAIGCAIVDGWWHVDCRLQLQGVDAPCKWWWLTVGIALGWLISWLSSWLIKKQWINSTLNAERAGYCDADRPNPVHRVPQETRPETQGRGKVLNIPWWWRAMMLLDLRHDTFYCEIYDFQAGSEGWCIQSRPIIWWFSYVYLSVRLIALICWQMDMHQILHCTG